MWHLSRLLQVGRSGIAAALGAARRAKGSASAPCMPGANHQSAPDLSSTLPTLPCLRNVHAAKIPDRCANAQVPSTTLRARRPTGLRKPPPGAPSTSCSCTKPCPALPRTLPLRGLFHRWSLLPQAAPDPTHLSKMPSAQQVNLWHTFRDTLL